jgi:hypothetical protein
VSALQLTTFVGLPLVIVFVASVLLAFARPDRGDGDGLYASYLAVARLFGVYMGLLAAAGLAEAISQRIVLGEPAGEANQFSGLSRIYTSLIDDGGGAPIGAFATLLVLMIVVYVYHARRASELATEQDPAAIRVERAYAGAVCFAMLSLVISAGLVAGAAGYDFFSEPIATSNDHLRDLAMGALLVYGGLVLVAGLIFRANVWAIRGNDETPDDDVTVTEIGEA